MSDVLQRYSVCALFLAIGVQLIRVGRHNVRTLIAEETGKARMTNRLLGIDNTYTGGMAKFVGIGRIVMGVVCIITAIVVAIFGPLLKKQG